MKPADYQLFRDLLTQMSELAERIAKEPSPEPVHTGPRIDTFAGLSVGPREEVRDGNYKRMPCTFVYDNVKAAWTNESPIHFPPAMSPYGADSVLLDGGAFVQRVVARLAAPVMLQAGQGVAYAAGALTVERDQMERATETTNLDSYARQPITEKEKSLYEQFRWDTFVSNAARQRAIEKLEKERKAFESLRERMESEKADVYRRHLEQCRQSAAEHMLEQFKGLEPRKPVHYTGILSQEREPTEEAPVQPTDQRAALA